MALATRCPACSTVFRISTAQAAAKGGMVRCGQCRNVFNSLDALVRVEDLEVIDETQVAPPVVETMAPEPEPEPTFVAATDATDATQTAEATDVVTVVEHELEPAAADAQPVDDASDRPVISEWWLPDPSAPRPAASETPALAVDGLAPLRDDAGRMLSGRRTDLQWSGADLDGAAPSFMRSDEPPAPAHRAVRWLLGVLIVVALAGLAAQATYLWRDELAARWSPAKPWLVSACRLLQCRIDYPIHPDAITIESASVQTTGANLNVYVLTALLRNREPIDLRYPHLELVLTDLQDQPILRRALRPEDYLPAGRAGGFAAESELPIRITFELSDLRFAGFRLDRFYP